MILQRILIGFGLATLLLAARPGIAEGRAQQAQRWEQVRALKPRSRIAVELKSGKTLEGHLSSVSDNTLTLEKDKKKRDIERTDIRTVHHVRRRIGRTTLRGMLIGYRITAPFRRVLSGNGRTGSGLASAILTGAALAVIAVVIPAGAAGGVTVGLVHRHREPIYNAGP